VVAVKRRRKRGTKRGEVVGEERLAVAVTVSGHAGCDLDPDFCRMRKVGASG
jgi:hypothetical protein